MPITRRNLPHISNSEESYFVTYRQKGTWLTEIHRVEPVLAKPEIASIILESWSDLIEEIKLHAVCVMTDHVHVILTTTAGVALPDVLERHKKFTARRINQALGKQGPFWQQESFDRVLREGKLVAAIQYTLMNPVKAGFVADWREWPFVFLAEEFREIREKAFFL